MSQLERSIKDHYDALSAQRVKIVVEEWNTEFWVAPMTIGQACKIDSEDDNYLRACRIIQVRAKKEDGSPAFDEGDYQTMVSHGTADLVFDVGSKIVKAFSEAAAPEKKF